MDHVDIDTEVVPRASAGEIALGLAPYEGAADLPRALFAREVLARGGCVVATAHAEREGEELALEAVEALGETLQATIDRRGLVEALLRAPGAELILLRRRRRGAIEASVAAADGARAAELASSLAAAIRIERHPRDTRIAVAFWSGPSGDLFSASGPRWRRLVLPRFVDIEDNYPAGVRRRLGELYAQPSGEALPGRLALWHGPPGTGKTWALRALGREWNSWCDLHYVTDPERLLGGDTSYMLEILAARSEPLDVDDEDKAEESSIAATREPAERWRLLVLEDAGELLGISAPAEVGRGFARLLNIADGLLSQGTRALILVTTNEPLGKLHPAALRPGRAMATLEFAPLAPAEASTWLAERGIERGFSASATIAELHTILAGAPAAADAVAAGVPVGFG